MPESFAKSFNAYRDSGFWSIDLNAELGGMAVPPSVRWGVNEMLLGSNPAVAMFAASYGFAKLLHALGNDEQKKLAQWIADKGWHCTMVLTEPDAGSDVGAKPHQGGRHRRRHVDHLRRQALHHQRRVRHGRQRRPLCSRAPRAPAPAPRACRCSC